MWMFYSVGIVHGMWVIPVMLNDETTLHLVFELEWEEKRNFGDEKDGFDEIFDFKKDGILGA